MDKPDPYGEWVIWENQPAKNKTSSPGEEELLTAARAAWPRVLAHARRELADKALGEEKTALAADVWEGVLRSVSKTLQRGRDHKPAIADLQSYLIGAFHHRFNRALKREQKRQQIIQLVPSTLDLERLKSTRDSDWVSELERAITVREIIEHMDDWTRRVWKARQYGYSWKEIANHLGLNEQQAKMRFRYGLEKTRDNLFNLLRRQRPNRPSQE